MPWLCYLRHEWFITNGSRRRTCLRCKRYQTWERAHYGHDGQWVDDAR